MSKKNFLVGFVILSITTIAGYGVSKSLNNEAELESLTLPHIEALADGEVKWNHWTQWFSQGFTQNEKAIREQCPKKTETTGGGSGSYNGGSVSGSGSHKQENPIGRTDIRCTDGNENCTSIDC